MRLAYYYPHCCRIDRRRQEEELGRRFGQQQQFFLCVRPTCLLYILIFLLLLSFARLRYGVYTSSTTAVYKYGEWCAYVILRSSCTRSTPHAIFGYKFVNIYIYILCGRVCVSVRGHRLHSFVSTWYSLRVYAVVKKKKRKKKLRSLIFSLPFWSPVVVLPRARAST